MPRYYFHIYMPGLEPDDVGQEHSNIQAAELEARRGASELIAEQIVRGELVSLDDRLEIEGDDGVELTLRFGDLFKTAAG